MVEFEKININQIKPAEYNPRIMKPSEALKLKNNLETFGLVDPIIVDLTDNNTVIGGHQRLEALKEIDEDMDLKLLRLGDIGLIFRETELHIKDKNDQKALNLSLNKIQGEWDWGKVDEVLLDLNDDGYQIELTGFDDSEIELEYDEFDDLFPDGNELPSDQEVLNTTDRQDESNNPTQENTETETPQEEMYTPLKEVNVIVNKGDTWKLGNHTLYCGDSSKKEDIKHLISDEKIDLILTDPPYGITIVQSKNNERERQIKEPWESQHQQDFPERLE